MKPGYKIIIAGVLIYGGLKIKATMDVAPYKEQAVSFTRLLTQNRSFEAQTLLNPLLQQTVSIEKLQTFIREQNLTQGREISWTDWEERDDSRYILKGSLLFADTRKLPVAFLLFSPDDNSTWIEHFKIGPAEIHAQESNSSGMTGDALK